MAATTETLAFLRDVRVFEAFSDSDLSAVVDRLRERELRRRQILFREGDAGDEMFIVRRGTILISKAVTGKVEQVLVRVEPGDFFGEMSLFDGSPRSATAQAETDVELLVLDRDSLRAMTEATPRAAAAFFYAMVQVFMERLRREAEEDFELREVPSVVGYINSRPRRVDPESYEISELRSRLAGPPGFILKNRKTDRFLLLSAQERFLWDKMDGKTSLQEIATAYVLAYGEFDFDIIPNLLNKLQRARLLTFEPRSRLRKALARNRDRILVKALELVLTGLERIRIASRNVHPFFQFLYRYGGFALFTPAAIVACIGLALLGAGAAFTLFRGMRDVLEGFGGRALLGLLAVKLLFFASLALHQFVHGLACIHYRRRVREFGFTFLHGFVPTFYVDVTDIFMVGRRARVVTAVTGTLVHLILGAVAFIVAVMSPVGSFTQAFAAASGIIQCQALVIALYPFCFIEMDGYHVLVDALGVPTLKHDALAYVRGLLTGTGYSRFGREEALWLGYVVLSTLSVAAFIAFNIWIIASATS